MIDSLITKNRDFLLSVKAFRNFKKELHELSQELNTRGIVTLSGIRHSGKTKLISQLVTKTGSHKKVFYYNAELDKAGTISSEKDLMTLMDIYVRAHGVPKIVILQNTNSIEGIKNFIQRLYKSKKYKILLVGNNIKVQGVTNIELFPLGIRSQTIDSYYFGGIPEVRIIPDIAYKKFLLESLSHDIVSQDILRVYHIKSIDLFYRVLYYLSLAKSYQSLREIHRNLRQYHIDISLLTLSDYISAGINTYLLHRSYLYDCKSEKFISSKAKYFFGDVGIKYAFSGEEGKYLENLLYLEFRSRGYEVSGAVNGRFEFEIYARKDENSFEIALGNPGEDKNDIRKKARKLAKIDSPSKKFILLEHKDHLHIRKFQEQGVKIIDLSDFLKMLG